MTIEVRGIVKRFGAFEALRGIDLEIKTGELVALLGPSGSGKTTLLRVISGLEAPDEGEVLFDGQAMTGKKAGERRVGFVFQHYALFRHMSVFENVAFGLKVRPPKSRPTRVQIARQVHRLLKLVRLKGMVSRYPSQLSGGQRQRVALARALAIEPRVLLLDEPFGALDAKVRRELRQWLRELHDKLQTTSVFVTHDQEEALELADRVVVMNEGRIEQIGTPDEVYHRPASPFVVHFLGSVNLFHCRYENGAPRFTAAAPGAEGGRNPGIVFVRPHLLAIHRAAEAGSFPARVKAVRAAGPLVRVELLAANGRPVEAELSQERYRALGLKPGEEVHVVPQEMQSFEDYSI